MEEVELGLCSELELESVAPDSEDGVVIEFNTALGPEPELPDGGEEAEPILVLGSTELAGEVVEIEVLEVSLEAGAGLPELKLGAEEVNESVEVEAAAELELEVGRELKLKSGLGEEVERLELGLCTGLEVEPIVVVAPELEGNAEDSVIIESKVYDVVLVAKVGVRVLQSESIRTESLLLALSDVPVELAEVVGPVKLVSESEEDAAADGDPELVEELSISFVETCEAGGEAVEADTSVVLDN